MPLEYCPSARYGLLAKHMNTNLQTQWQRLILPPDGVPILAGEQLCEGNRYPDVTGPLD